MIARLLVPLVLALAGAVACGRAAASRSSGVDTVFADGFESGSLAAWDDGMDVARHRVVQDPAGARSGSHYLQVTYPPGNDGGWLTAFLPPGYDSLYVSAHVRFPPGWRGGTKLLALYGSRVDNQWSAFGQAGQCPSGADFFAAMLVAEGSGDPGRARFYTYYPAMAREPDGVTCWGRFGDGAERYELPGALARGDWHHIEFWVRLNTPARADASQEFWIDGVPGGTWSGFSLRSSEVLRLNALQMTFSRDLSGTTAQHLDLDEILVATERPKR